MATSAIAHLKYDLDHYASALRRTATLAASFFIKNSLIRFEYLKDIEDDLNEANRRFHDTFDPNEKIRIINEVKADAELTEREYQLLRQGSYTKYIITDIFEDQGVIKYAKVGVGVVSGVVQTVGGVSMFKLGRNFHQKHLSGLGAVLFAHGANNVFESLSPVLPENQRQRSSYLRNLYRKAAEIAGFGRDHGDFAYSIGDFAITLYSSTRGLTLQQNRNSLIPKRWFQTPGTGRLFRYLNKDFVPKWETKSPPMKLFLGGTSVYKLKAIIYDHNYIYNGD
ncbi:DUF4225 domain-containing protein [Erwinia sorbitola]|nr:DUF4225 domain-containing protein [Erwinia sorbitola]